MEQCCKCKKQRCARHGDCESCRAFHKEKNTSPYCERETERIKRREERRRARGEARQA